MHGFSAVSGHPARSYHGQCLEMVVRIKGLEPSRELPHSDLNAARLPIPPYPHTLVLVARLLAPLRAKGKSNCRHTINACLPLARDIVQPDARQSPCACRTSKVLRRDKANSPVSAKTECTAKCIHHGKHTGGNHRPTQCVAIARTAAFTSKLINKNDSTAGQSV